MGAPGHVPADYGLANVGTELERFAMNAGRVTERPGKARPTDWVMDFVIRLWAIRDSVTENRP